MQDDFTFAYVFLGAMFILFAVVIRDQYLYRKEVLIQRLCERFGLQAVGGALQRPGLNLEFKTVSSGNHRSHFMHFEMALPVIPQSLQLVEEGARAGFQARSGVRELQSGDVDFDDFFFVTGQGIEELSQERRLLLLDFCHSFPGSQVENARLRGRSRFFPGRAGYRLLVETVENLERFQRQMAEPEGSGPRRPPGWVARSQRRRAALWCLWYFASCWFFHFYLSMLDFPAWNDLLDILTGLVGATGLSFLASGCLVGFGSRLALRSLQLARLMSFLACALLLGIYCYAQAWPVAIVAGLLCALLHYRMWVQSLVWSRIRLRLPDLTA